MKSKLSFLILLLGITSASTYALTCEPTYQSHPFKRVVIPVDGFEVRCHYQTNGADELTYYIGDSIQDSYIPTKGNWTVRTPRFWECRGQYSSECSFEKMCS